MFSCSFIIFVSAKITVFIAISLSKYSQIRSKCRSMFKHPTGHTSAHFPHAVQADVGSILSISYISFHPLPKMPIALASFFCWQKALHLPHFIHRFRLIIKTLLNLFFSISGNTSSKSSCTIFRSSAIFCSWQNLFPSQA